MEDNKSRKTISFNKNNKEGVYSTSNDKILDSVYENSHVIKVKDHEKIVLFSDCHRGDGTFKDSLFPNANIYLTALRYYYRNDYTYIEVGDGDELWKFKNLNDIYEANEDIYLILNELKKKQKLYMISGNHDDVKSKKKFLNSILKYKDYERRLYDFYKDLKIYKGIILRFEDFNQDIFVTHGHQVDFINYQMMCVSKFLVRNVWGFLVGIMGFKDIVSPVRSKNRKRKIDMKLQLWAKSNNKGIIAGHTHRTIFPSVKETQYFNIGGCVLPYTVTAIEIENNTICLVKWTIKALNEGQLVVLREIIGGPNYIKKINL